MPQDPLTPGSLDEGRVLVDAVGECEDRRTLAEAIGALSVADLRAVVLGLLVGRMVDRVQAQLRADEARAQRKRRRSP